MKKIIILILISLSQAGLAQTIDTIYCNAYQNVIITTPEPIYQATTGSENFVFSYNQTAADTLGLLQGKPGHTGNLVIRTRDGGMYTFLLEYKESLPGYTYFLKSEDRVNWVKPEEKIIKKVTPGAQPTSPAIPKSYYENLSKMYLKSTGGRKAVGRQKGLVFEILDMKYTRRETFITYRIQNRSAINFEVAQMELFSLVGKAGRKSAYQELKLQPLYEYQLPGIINSGEEKTFVVAYKRFTLYGKKRLKGLLTEARGSRQVSVELR